MPLIEKHALSSGTEDWLAPNCKARQGLGRRQVSWDLRHELLLTDASSAAWFVAEPRNRRRFSKEGLIEGLACDLSWVSHEAADQQQDSLSVAAVRLQRNRVSRIRAEALMLRAEFDALSKRWQRDTKHLSLVSKTITHPAYFRIIGMGEAAIPLILEALRVRPAHWFAALRATANTDPSRLEDTPSEAREAWLLWGIAQGYID